MLQTTEAGDTLQTHPLISNIIQGKDASSIEYSSNTVIAFVEYKVYLRTKFGSLHSVHAMQGVVVQVQYIVVKPVGTKSQL